MILRNYDNIALSWKQIVSNSNTPLGDKVNEFGDGFLTIKNTEGVIGQPQAQYGYMALQYFGNRSGPNDLYSGGENLLWCGSGGTLEHYDDYCLEAPFTQDQVKGQSDAALVFEDYDSTTGTRTYTYTRTYSALEDIFVREIGVYYADDFYPYESSDDERTLFLLYRQVLPAPIEVETGGLFKLTFSITAYPNPNKPADYVAKVESITE